EVLAGFAERGLAVVLISHHLAEVRRAAHRVTVLRDGRRVAQHRIEEVTNRELAELITGEERPTREAVPRGTAGSTRLDVDELVVTDGRGLEVVHSVSLSVAAGEIVAVLGIAGNGQTELVEAITGLRTPSSGRIVVD